MKDYSYLTKDYCGILELNNKGFIFYNDKRKIDVITTDSETYTIQISNLEKKRFLLAVSFRNEKNIIIFIQDLLHYNFEKKGSQMSLFEVERL